MAFSITIPQQKKKETIEFYTTFITLKILASHGAMAPWILATPL